MTFSGQSWTGTEEIEQEETGNGGWKMMLESNLEKKWEEWSGMGMLDMMRGLWG
jgi:hypothetical protein